MRFAVVIVLASMALVATSCGGKKSGTPAASSTTTASTTTTAAGSTTTTAAATTTTHVKLDKLIGNPIAGKKVWFKSNCGACHSLKAAGATATIGMDFDYLKPAQENIVETVPAGGDVMPAYPALTKKQLYDLAAFVYKSTH